MKGHVDRAPFTLVCNGVSSLLSHRSASAGSVAGVGLFAEQPLAAQTVLGVFTGVTLARSEAMRLRRAGAKCIINHTNLDGAPGWMAHEAAHLHCVQWMHPPGRPPLKPSDVDPGRAGGARAVNGGCCELEAGRERKMSSSVQEGEARRGLCCSGGGGGEASPKPERGEGGAR